MCSATTQSLLARSAAPVVAAAVLAAWSIAHGAGHDYIQFHAAATLIAAGENPYGAAEQARAQRPFRGGPEPDNLYDRLGFLPYFYPPWLALACVPLARLPYPVARGVWVFLGAACLSLAGVSLARDRDRIPGGGRGPVPPAAAAVLALGLMPCYYAIQLGQTTPLIVALLAVAIGSLDRGADRTAGVALAWLSVKPQLTVVALPAALLWASRRRRWGVVAWFAGTLAVIAAACTRWVPAWPVEMLLATRRTPLPTAIDPSVGVTWPCVLRSLDVSGWPLALGCVAAAVPAVALALTAAWDRDRPASEAIGRGVVAAFLVAPYALGYDLAVLIVPLLTLLPALPRRSAAWLLVTAAVGPYLALSAVVAGILPMASLFVLPAGLALLAARASPPRPHLPGTEPNRAQLGLGSFGAPPCAPSAPRRKT